MPSQTAEVFGKAKGIPPPPARPRQTINRPGNLPATPGSIPRMKPTSCYHKPTQPSSQPPQSRHYISPPPHPSQYRQTPAPLPPPPILTPNPSGYPPNLCIGGGRKTFDSCSCRKQEPRTRRPHVEERNADQRTPTVAPVL
ncbi:uncharacterized protein LOC135217620 [Macrobrachium nipponense]|uniref:uncharacterized protein LOC135217620 n=1 Tax=Macrobrachium nipponense TaxID=159736 RepID=UPI0030C862E6